MAVFGGEMLGFKSLRMAPTLYIVTSQLIGGIAVVSAIAAGQLPRNRDVALAGRVGPLPAGDED